jgi:hypothetical protein
MPHFIHDGVWIVLGKRHCRTFALFRTIRRDASVRGNLLPGGTERRGILLHASEELWFVSIITLGNDLLERPPDVVEGRRRLELRGISDIQKLRERTGRETQL